MKLKLYKAVLTPVEWELPGECPGCGAWLLGGAAVELNTTFGNTTKGLFQNSEFFALDPTDRDMEQSYPNGYLCGKCGELLFEADFEVHDGD
jgi:hypothetical protein